MEKGYDPSKGQTGTYRSNWDAAGLAWQPTPTIHNLQELWEDSIRQFSQNRYLGTIELQEDESMFCKGIELTPVVHYRTYAEINTRARALGSALRRLELVFATDPAAHVSPLCLYSRNREEWMVVDLACVVYGLTTIPFYDTLSLDSIPFILNQTSVPIIFCGQAEAARLAQIKDLGKLRDVVFFDLVEETAQKLTQRGLRVHYFENLIEEGRKSFVE